jgi:hypothetical protein
MAALRLFAQAPARGGDLPAGDRFFDFLFSGFDLPLLEREPTASRSRTIAA